MTKAIDQADKLEPRCLTAILISSIIEYEIFSFTKVAVIIAKQDAWLAVLAGIFAGIMFVYLFIKLAARFSQKGYFEILNIVWGKPLGIFFAIVYLLFWLLLITLLFYETSMANKLFFLPRTPQLIPLLIFAVLLLWLVSNGIIPIIRFFQTMLPFLIFPLLFLAILFVKAVEINNFLPVLSSGWVPIFKGAFYFLGAVQGPEVLLFLSPFISRIDQGMKPALLGYAIPVFFAWITGIAAIGILGVKGIGASVMPGIDVATLIELPGFHVERFELLLTLPWLIGIYTTMAIYLYLLCSSIIQLLNIKHKKPAAGVLTVLPILLSYLIPDMICHETLRNFLTLFTPALVYFLPALTLGLAVIGKKGEV